jgi:5-formyltetrahydrofolate cyclo-ligase
MTAVPSHKLKRLKTTWRREVRARRDALAPPERAAKSIAIADRVLALPEVTRARTVLAFWSFGSEVDTGPILERLHDAGVRVALPRIEGREVVPVAWAPGDPVTETAFGALEPAGADVLAEVGLDLILTPGLAFDRRGFRLGYGGGYYDRLFRRTGTAAFRVAIGFGIQVVEEVPHGRADLAVHAIVTETEVIRCPSP